MHNALKSQQHQHFSLNFLHKPNYKRDQPTTMTLFRTLCLIPLLSTFAFGLHENCRPISDAFRTSNQPACRCFTTGLRADATGDTTWIGCTQKDILQLYASLDALPNATSVSKLWMWDCSLPVLIPALFNKVRPITLKIESSTTRKWAKGVFDPLADRLKHLELKQNQVLDLNKDSFAKLKHLTRLDLSGNHVTKLSPDSLGVLASLRQLYLQKNEIKTIADDTFLGMTELRHLSLAHNKIEKITKRTFAGLDNLESLTLSDNHIAHIEPGAFSHMTKLRSLNLGRNLLTELQLDDMPTLNELLLYRNAFNSLAKLQLSQTLPSLNSLSLDRNMIQRIDENELKNMPNLNSLLLAFNQITFIHENALYPVKQLRTLSLQNNKLTSVHDGLFLPVMMLENLLLSDNKLEMVSERTFYGLRHLKVLVLTKNNISHFHRRALAGTFGLQRLYINQNKLQTIENGTFVYINSSVRSVDMSENPWECNCSLLWLTGWLWNRSHLAINLDITVCRTPYSSLTSHTQKTSLIVAYDALRKNCASGDDNSSIFTSHEATHSVWITVIAVVLAVVSLMILAAIAVLYVQELRRGIGGMEFMTKHYGLSKAPSDMDNLITPSTGNINEAAGHTTHTGAGGLTNTAVGDSSNNKAKLNNNNTDNNREKKHVRFQTNSAAATADNPDTVST